MTAVRPLSSRGPAIAHRQCVSGTDGDGWQLGLL